MLKASYTFVAKYLDGLREYAPIYRAGFLRGILETIRDGRPAPDKDPHLYVYRSISKIFEDCEAMLQANIINYFLGVELPSLEADERAEKARCDAIDELLECLNDKSAREITNLTRQIEGEEAI